MNAVAAKELSPTKVLQLFNAYRDYCMARANVYGQGKVHRMPNFPEDISENIIKQYIQNIENRQCKWDTVKGDLEVASEEKEHPIKVEVKCFSSNGPLSFGPNEYWDELYWLDARELISTNMLKIYRTHLPFGNEVIKSIPVNKKETFHDQCVQKRRPRFTLDVLMRHAPDSTILLYSGPIDGILRTVDE